MKLTTENYLAQTERWPAAGHHILAQFDEQSVFVYQAYRPAIAEHAVRHQRFGGPFSMSRMTWIKPNFLWMMYRCGWATKVDQERVLAIRLSRAGFDELLQKAVHSSFAKHAYKSREDWKARIKNSDVRLQWDPDHGPAGEKEPRRAIQLGIRGQALESYVNDWTIAIEDITPFVESQRNSKREQLITPSEAVYPVSDPAVQAHLSLAE